MPGRPVALLLLASLPLSGAAATAAVLARHAGNVAGSMVAESARMELAIDGLRASSSRLDGGGTAAAEALAAGADRAFASAEALSLNADRLLEIATELASALGVPQEPLGGEGASP